MNDTCAVRADRQPPCCPPANLRPEPPETSTSGREGTWAETLNRACFCLGHDEAALARALDVELGQAGLADLVRVRCPHLFASRPVFVGRDPLRQMAKLVQAIESLVALPAFVDEVLATAPDIARHGAVGPTGVFFGYDFHVDAGRVGLIEINTNAGGALLNAALARAQRACCTGIEPIVPPMAEVLSFERSIVAMFRNEWRLAGHARPLETIAIVDETPEQQYLYPEFVLFKQLFERHGIQALIADPAALAWRRGRLWHEDIAIDLVYNRLTDFYLEASTSVALREAYLSDAVVLTPHPRAHALYADKRHLALFSDAERLRALDVPEATRRLLLDSVPRTEIVRADRAERLWNERRGLFFKPMAGFGGRATYRGDKLTRRVWQDILAGDYVAQAIVTPGERLIDDEGTTHALKFDLRHYVYGGEVQWLAARLYQGQTTNFRTSGGGFAPVYSTVS